MTCRHAELQLNALADHALNPWQASHVRRHLAACPACAAEFAEIQRLDASVQAWRNVPAPSTLGPRIAAALPPSAAFQTRRRAFPLRPAAVGLAGLAAGLAAIFWFLPGQPGQPMIAFADVQKAMQQVQIASWKTHYIVTDANWRTLAQKQMPGPDFTTWVRRNPPTVATIGQPHGFQSLEDKHGDMDRTAQGNYLWKPNNKQREKDFSRGVEEQIESLTQASMTSPSTSDPHLSVYTIVANPRQQSVVQDGQRQILFTHNEEIVVRINKHVPEMHYFQQHNTWVDPVSHLVTRTESRNWGDKMSGQFNQRQVVVSDNFRYNQAPPPGVFDWSPPPGANVINMNDLRVGKGLRLYLPKKNKGK